MNPNEFVDFLSEYVAANAATVENQPFFSLLRYFALQGMGIGLGDAIATSGEGVAAAHVAGVLAERYPNEPLDIFDVGANVGQFVSVCRSIFGTEARHYYCFEPSSETFAALSERTGSWPDVQRLQMALGDLPGEMTLFTNQPKSGLASLYKRRLDHFGIDMSMTETVQVSTLDRVTTELGIQRVHFLKLDIEGYEFQCLQGAERLITEQRINFIQFEFGGTNIDSRTYFQDFWYLLKDYEIYRILKDGLLAVEQYSEAEEMFQTQNYLAALRQPRA